MHAESEGEAASSDAGAVAPGESDSGGEEKRVRKGIYILPNLFTTAALFSGFFAIVQAGKGHFEPAAIAIYIAMILDGLDGRVARLTHTESDFGIQYDSLSDMVAFGLSPALVIYEWALSGMGKLGWLASFIYVAAAALRLARFNTQQVANKRYFQGLPSPAGAAFVAGLVWVADGTYGLKGASFAIPALVLTVLIGLAMVSNIRYRSFKDVDLKGKVPFVAAISVVVAIVVVAFDPARVLFVLFLLYFVSGPIGSVFRSRRSARERAARARRTPPSA